MSRKVIVLGSIVCLLAGAGVFAGMGYTMKCNGVPDADGQPAKESCGYSTEVMFGGGMFFEQLTGYCRACKKFVHLSWTRPGAVNNMPAGMEVKPKPKALGEVFDATTGHVLSVYACPHCAGPFAEIKSQKDLKHCPSCLKGEFGIDPNAPVMAID